MGIQATTFADINIIKETQSNTSPFNYRQNRQQMKAFLFMRNLNMIKPHFTETNQTNLILSEKDTEIEGEIIRYPHKTTLLSLQMNPVYLFCSIISSQIHIC